MSKTQHIYHVVFATKGREKTITLKNKRFLYRELYSILVENECYVYRINGIDDHVHILFDLNPNILLKDIVRVLKGKSSYWMTRSGLFPIFRGWGREYFGVSKGIEQVEILKNYIKNQEVHHLNVGFVDEMKLLYENSGLDWHEKDLM